MYLTQLAANIYQSCIPLGFIITVNCLSQISQNCRKFQKVIPHQIMDGHTKVHRTERFFLQR